MQHAGCDHMIVLFLSVLKSGPKMKGYWLLLSGLLGVGLRMLVVLLLQVPHQDLWKLFPLSIFPCMLYIYVIANISLTILCRVETNISMKKRLSEDKFHSYPLYFFFTRAFCSTLITRPPPLIFPSFPATGLKPWTTLQSVFWSCGWREVKWREVSTG